MTYLSDKSKKDKKYKKYSIYAVILIAFVYFWPSVHSKIFPVLEPAAIFYGDSKTSFIKIPSALSTYFSSRSLLAEKNRALELDVERLENELAEKDEIIKENNFIQENVSDKPSSVLVMYPIMRDITTMYSTVLLSKGFKDGVEENDMVYIRGRNPACVIYSVSDKTSLCKFLSASGVVTEGVTSSSSIVLSLSGNGGGSFIADIPRGTDVTIGDTVYLASDKTMELGNIVDVNRDDQATSWKVYIRSMYNPVTSSVFYLKK